MSPPAGRRRITKLFEGSAYGRPVKRISSTLRNGASSLRCADWTRSFIQLVVVTRRGPADIPEGQHMLRLSWTMMLVELLAALGTGDLTAQAVTTAAMYGVVRGD